MKKEINIFEIDGVSYWEYKEKITKEFILDELDFFRKTNRPSYMFINALLEVKDLQQKIKELRRIIYDDKKYHVLYWFMFIIWLIVFSVWFRVIVCFFIKLFS